MSDWTYYDPSDGRIKATYSGSYPENNDALYPGCNRIEGAFSGIDLYFVDGEPTSRPSMGLTVSGTNIAADGVDAVTVSNVPDGATLSGVRDDETVNIVDGSFSITASVAGVRRYTVRCFPYLDHSFLVIAE